MDRMKSVSIIVPIYNVEEYLRKCIDSIINQTYANLEIILVDDGSPDNCPRICDEYADKDSRIKVIHKENGGLSDARNAGMKIATGEYVCFVDSDDWISELMVENLVMHANKNKADVVECNIIKVYDDHIENDNEDEYAVYTDNKAIMEAYIKYYRIKTVVWNKLYKRTIIEDIPFEVGKYNEDEFFTYKILSKAKVLVHINDYYYYYKQRHNSIMGEKFSLRKLDSLEGTVERALFIKEYYPDLYCFCLQNVTFKCIFSYQELLKNKELDRDRKARKKVKKYRKMFRWKLENLKGFPLDYKFYVLLSAISLEGCSRIRNLFNLGG